MILLLKNLIQHGIQTLSVFGRRKKKKRHTSRKHTVDKKTNNALKKPALDDQCNENSQKESSAKDLNPADKKEPLDFKQEIALQADVKQQKSFNVVLLAVSIFNNRNNKITQSRYRYGNELFGYQSQAEPVIRYLSQQLQFATPSDCIDRLILLCSDKAMEEKDMTFPDGTSKCISPFEFLKERTKDRVNPAISEEDMYKCIPIDVANPALAIQDTILELRHLKKAYGDHLQIYVDPHGGLRDIQQIMDAMLSLVKDEFHIKGSYSLEYDNNIAAITRKESGDIFDFVSGINEFANYGRIASLSKYYSNLEDTQIAHKAQLLMTPIRKIAESIQLCDIPAFESGLDELRQYYTDLDNASLPNTDEFEQQQKADLAYLALFQGKIREDYAELLSDNRSVSTEIEWCLKKGFYQQALTLIEGRMPEELQNKGIFSYSHAVQSYADHYREFYRRDVFIINRSIPYGIMVHLGLNKINCEPTVLGFLRTPDILDKVWNNELYGSEAQAFFADVWFYNKVRPEDVCSRWRNPFRKRVHLSCTNASHIFAFFLLHLGFKYLRNMFNHASVTSPNISTGELDSLIRKYLEWETILETEITTST